MRALVLAAALALTGCASLPSATDAAVVTANGAAAIATAGEATLAALYRGEQSRCLRLVDAPARSCVAGVRARYDAAWRAYGALRATWLSAAAVITAARASERSGKAPPLDVVASAVTEIIAAERSWAAAVAALKEAK